MLLLFSWALKQFAWIQIEQLLTLMFYYTQVLDNLHLYLQDKLFLLIHLLALPDTLKYRAGVRQGLVYLMCRGNP